MGENPGCFMGMNRVLLQVEVFYFTTSRRLALFHLFGGVFTVLLVIALFPSGQEPFEHVLMKLCNPSD